MASASQRPAPAETSRPRAGGSIDRRAGTGGEAAIDRHHGTGVHALARGGHMVLTSRGPVQFGAPPETIKDSIGTDHGVAGIFVLGHRFFCHQRSVSLAEVEFPIYYNFFVLHRRMDLVCTAAQRARVVDFMREALLGPEHIDLSGEVQGTPAELRWLPDLRREMAAFGRNPFEGGRPLTLDAMVRFVLFEPAEGPDQGQRAEVRGLHIHRAVDGSSVLIDPASPDAPVSVPALTEAPWTHAEQQPLRKPFQPPRFGVTILGSGHGFEPTGRTTGFVLWINGRGILVDPPVDSADDLAEQGVSPRCIDAAILTHCHADHDGGLLQKALQAERIKVYSTRTVFESFLRKSEAITGLAARRFDAVLDFHPVRLRQPIHIAGGRFVFDYSLHSIPALRFQVWLAGRSMVYSGDTQNDPERIRELAAEGVLSEGRAADLLDYPWDHDLIIHEAGVPPLHTSPHALARLPDDVKARMVLVHTAPSSVPEGLGLKVAETGLSATIRLKVPPQGHARALRWLRALRAVEHFRTLPAEKAVEFLEVAEERTFPAGSTIIRAGTPGTAFCIILRGQAAVLHGEVPSKRMGLHEYFGEAALLRGAPRAADVVALTDVTLLLLPRDPFLQFIEGTEARARMLRLSANRDAGTWPLLDRHPVLRAMSTAQRTEMQSFMRGRDVCAGEDLLREGDPESLGCVVAAGSLLEWRGGSEVGRYGEGELVADFQAVVDALPARHTLTAAADGRVYVLDHAPFRTFLRANPGVYMRLLRIY